MVYEKIKGLFALSYSERLKRLQLDSLCVRRLKSDLIMCYKILNKLVDLDCSDFFVLANSNRTRGHSRKLFTQQCSLDVRKYCFANRVVGLGTIYPTILSGLVVLVCFVNLSMGLLLIFHGIADISVW